MERALGQVLFQVVTINIQKYANEYANIIES